MASVASHNGTNISTGNNIMIAGLAFQVVTLFVFIILVIDFAIRTLRHKSKLDHDPTLVALRSSLQFRLFVAALSVSTICIFWRSVFRVAELSDGWTGPIMKQQNLFVGFEGVMVVVAILLLNIWHPNLSFKGMEKYHKRISEKKKSDSATPKRPSVPSDDDDERK